MNEYLNMCIAEVHDLISEKDKYNNIILLNCAYETASMVFREKIYDIYKEFSSNIDGVKSHEVLKRNIARYRMISERLKLKFPKMGCNNEC